VVALYFSASWCPPCKTFSPRLIDFYLAAAKDNGLEIVYVSSDKTVESFETYVSAVDDITTFNLAMKLGWNTGD
jgi:nucleoredoxin